MTSEKPNYWSRELTEREFLLALELNEAPKSGYQAGKAVEEEHGIPLTAPGTLYGVLGEMVQRGFVSKRDAGKTRKTNVYALTDAGRRAVLRDTERYEQLAGRTRQSLGLGEENIIESEGRVR